MKKGKFNRKSALKRVACMALSLCMVVTGVSIPVDGDSEMASAKTVEKKTVVNDAYSYGGDSYTYSSSPITQDSQGKDVYVRFRSRYNVYIGKPVTLSTALVDSEDFYGQNIVNVEGLTYSWAYLDSDYNEVDLNSDAASLQLTPTNEMFTNDDEIDVVCTVDNGTDQFKAYMTLGLNSPINVDTRYVTSTIRLNAGETGILYAPTKVDAGFTLSYEWKNSKGDVVGNGATLNVAAPAANVQSETYDLTVKATYAGSQESYEAHYFYNVNLNVYQIEYAKDNAGAKRGENVTFNPFKLTYDANAYDLTGKWYFDDEELVSGAEYTIDGSNNLTINNITGERFGLYTYRVELKSKTASADDSSYFPTVRISDSYMLNEFTGFQSYTSKKNVEVPVGGTANLQIFAKNSDSAKYPISYEWETPVASGSAIVYVPVQPNYTDENGNNVVTVAQDQTGSSLNLTYASADGFDVLKEVRCTVYEKYGEEVVRSIEYEFNISEDKSNTQIYTASDNLVYAKIGDTKALAVNVSGAAKVKYVWDKLMLGSGRSDDYEIIDGAETNTYNAVVSTANDLTTYRCHVFIGENEYETIRFYLRNNDIYQEAVSATEAYAKLGDQVIFKIRGVSANAQDQFTYQWYGPNGRIPGATTDTLTVAGIAKKDFGSYFCYVRDVTAGEFASALNYSGLVQYDIYQYTGVTVDDKYNEFEKKEGESVTFSPTVNNPDNLPLTYVWSFEPDNSGEFDGELLENTGILSQYGFGVSDYYYASSTTDPKLTISNIKKALYGDYTLYVIYDNAIVAKKYYYLNEDTTEDEIKIKRLYDYNLEFKLGATATMGIKATHSANKPLRYQWYFGGLAIYGANSDTLVLQNLKAADFGRYYVEVTDGKITEDVDFYIERITDLKVNNLAEEDGYAISICGNYEKSLTLTADVKSEDANYDTDYQWYFKNSLNTDKSYDYANITNSNYLIYGAKTKEFKIDKLNGASVGYYTCQVSNTYRKYNVTYFVYVNTGLLIKVTKKNPTATIGKAFTFKTTVTTNKKFKKDLKIQWSKYNKKTDRFEDIAGANAATYKLPTVTEESFGTYKITANNGVQERSTTIFLSEKMVFGVDRVRSSTQATLEGSLIKLSADVVPATDSAIKTTYEWYIADQVTGNFRKVDQAYKYKVTKKKVKKKVKVKVKGKTKTKTKTVIKKTKKLVKFNGNAKTIYVYAPKLETADGDSYADHKYITYKVSMTGKYADGSIAYINGNKCESSGSTGFYLVSPEWTSNVKKLQTAHKYEVGDEVVLGYKVVKAKKLKVKFNKKTAVDANTYDYIYVINSKGQSTLYTGKQLAKKTLTVKGNKFAILMISHGDPDFDKGQFGIKIDSVKGANKGLVTEKSKITLNVKETYKIVYSDKLVIGAKGVKFSSSKKAVAAVSNKGVITAKKAGKAVITLKKGKKKAKINVTVKKVKKAKTTKTDEKKTEEKK